MRYCVLLVCLLGIGLVAGSPAKSNSSAAGVVPAANKTCSLGTLNHIVDFVVKHPFGWILKGSYVFTWAKKISSNTFITFVTIFLVGAFGIVALLSACLGFFLGTLSVSNPHQKDRSPLFASSQPAYFPVRYQPDDFSSMNYVDTGNMENYMDFVDSGNIEKNSMDDIGTSYTENGGKKSYMDKIYKGDEGFMGENDRAYKRPQPAPRPSKVASDNSASAKYDFSKHESKP